VRSPSVALVPISLLGRVRAPVDSLGACKVAAEAFSIKDAKNLSELCTRAVKNLESRGCTHASFKPATKKGFWKDLVDQSAIPEHQMHKLYHATCLLLCTVHPRQVDTYVNALFGGSLQRAAAAVMYKLNPEAFHFPHAQAFHRCQHSSSETIKGYIWMHAWFEDVWRFAAFVDPGVCMHEDIGTVHTHTVGLPSTPAETSLHYKPQAQLLTRIVLLNAPLDEVGCHEFAVEEGASVTIRLVSPDDPAVKFVLELLGDPVSASPTVRNIFGNLDVAWVCQKLGRLEPYMVVERYLGLTHPQRPFAVSANTVVLENADDLAQVHGIAEQMGHDFAKSAVLSVPLSFPPALSDCDRTLQKAMCCAALNNNGFVGAALVEAVEAFAEELLGESVTDLGSFDDEEMATLLNGANNLVKQALAALQQAQLEELKSEAIATHIVDVLLTEAWYQIRCRHEWKQVEASQNSNP
jgi:hypothetical protein